MPQPLINRFTNPRHTPEIPLLHTSITASLFYIMRIGWSFIFPRPRFYISHFDQSPAVHTVAISSLFGSYGHFFPLEGLIHFYSSLHFQFFLTTRSFWCVVSCLFRLPPLSPDGRWCLKFCSTLVETTNFTVGIFDEFAIYQFYCRNSWHNKVQKVYCIVLYYKYYI